MNTLGTNFGVCRLTSELKFPFVSVTGTFCTSCRTFVVTITTYTYLLQLYVRSIQKTHTNDGEYCMNVYQTMDEILIRAISHGRFVNYLPMDVVCYVECAKQEVYTIVVSN